MQQIKLKAAMEKVKKRSIKAAQLANDATQGISNTSKSIKDVIDDPSSSSAEYASGKLEQGVETVTREAGHLAVDTTRYAFQAVKKDIQNRQKQDQRKKAGSVDNAPHHGENLQHTHMTQVQKVSTTPQATTVKTPEKVSERMTVKTADRSVKTVQRSIKTAEKTYAAVAKAADGSTKAVEKAVETTAKAAVKAKRIMEATAAATAVSLKAAAEAAVKAVKAIIAGIKDLIAAILAGGWVTVVVIVVILLVALILGSSFGIFFSSEDTGSSMTMQSVILEVNRDYSAKIDTIKNSVAHDELDTSGSQADWPEVLSVYAVRLNADPAKSTEVVTIDDYKKSILMDIFWDMNKISYTTSSQTEIVLEEVTDMDGNVQTVEVPVTTTTLHIQTSSKTALEMAEAYSFSDRQLEWLAELLKPEYEPLWAGVLYGIHNADMQIVAVALSQEGNVGGQPYWSWYGFSGRVEWCACFVSWCADQCGYIDVGIIPKFAGCITGGNWFIERGQWADNSYVPQPGDIIFFDWYEPGVGQDGERDHVGIVVKAENGYVYTIEGNSGDKCIQRTYPIGWYEINGYGLPAYP